MAQVFKFENYIDLSLQTDHEWSEDSSYSPLRMLERREHDLLFGKHGGELEKDQPRGDRARDITANKLSNRFNKGCILGLPGCDNLVVLRMAPDGPTRCLERAEILAPGDAPDSRLDAIRELFAQNFNREDIALVENVQRGLQSLGYDQGRYVVDADDSWYSESGLHRFHLQVLDALASD